MKDINKLDIHTEICGKLYDTYKQKNNDYGDSFAKRRKQYGNTAILIRLEDKMERLKVLMLGAEPMVKTESIEDTLMDLANYAILELIERQVEAENE